MLDTTIGFKIPVDELAFKSDEGGGFTFLGEFFRTLTIALRSSGYFITEFLNL